jgi:Rrf2 family protein
MLLSDIAASRGVPQSFLAKIFQKLTKHGIVRSFRGAIRGYTLRLPPTEIKLQEILVAIEGPEIFDRCIFWSQRCAETNACPLHERWKQIRQQFIATMLQRTTLADLLESPPADSEVVTPPLVQGPSERR